MSYRLKLQKKGKYQELEFIFDYLNGAKDFMQVAFDATADELVIAVEKEEGEACADIAEE